MTQSVSLFCKDTMVFSLCLTFSVVVRMSFHNFLNRGFKKLELRWQDKLIRKEKIVRSQLKKKHNVVLFKVIFWDLLFMLQVLYEGSKN